MGKIVSYMKRENPSVASQLSECLGAGTACGWCVPFLTKLHALYQAGEPMDLKVDFEKYAQRRDAFKERGSTPKRR